MPLLNKKKKMIRQQKQAAALKRSSNSRRLDTYRLANGGDSDQRPARLTRQKGDLNLSSARQQPTKATKPKIDIGKDRMIYPVEKGGITQYLPIRSQASKRELELGTFIEDDAVKGRDVLEKASVATRVLKQSPKRDFGKQRDVFAIETAAGKVQYLPLKSEATDKEIAKGLYVEDDALSNKTPLGAAGSMGSAKPKFDLGKKRKVYAVKTLEGKTIYLPAESAASDREKLSGYIIPDSVVEDYEAKRRHTALNDSSADQALRRAQRARKLGGGNKQREKRNST